MSRPARRLWPWLLALVFLGTALVAGLRVAERGRFSSPYSSYGAGPEGTLALLRLTEQLGFTAQRLNREISHLGLGTLVAIAGCHGGLVRPLLRPEREELARWVEAGGLLIVAGVDDYLPVTSGLNMDLPATCEDASRQGDESDAPDGLLAHERVPYRVEVTPSGPPLTNMLPFVTERARSVRALPGYEATVILESPAGILGLTTPLGRGRVVLLGVSEALTNRELAQGGGALMARLLESFAPKGPVWFDEYHLGMGERRSLVRYLRDRGFGLSLAQACLVVLAALLARAVRLGPARSPTGGPSLASRRYLAALGSLYARSRDAQGALAALARHAVRHVATHHRARAVRPEALPAWLEARGLRGPAASVRHIQALGTQPLKRGESLLARAQQIDAETHRALRSTAHAAPQEASWRRAPARSRLRRANGMN